MSNIIQVENLSKKYIIGHQQLKGRSTFREAISQSFINLGSKFTHPFSKKISSNSPYEEFWALKDINFEVEQGDRIGIIGRNGAGKSTVLKVLSRITEPTSGKITIKGRVASLLEVGTGFNGELTGRENIFLNGAILGMHRAEIKQKFDEIVDFSGVLKFLDTPVKRYSSGMYVRLAFAIAAHLEPEILIVDEVLAVGDAEFQKKCLGKMQDISGEGRTVIFVSHNINAIESLCSRIIVLDSGEKAFEGKTEDGINFYLYRNIKYDKTENLANRKDRQGNGRVKILKFDILDINENEVNQLFSGETYFLKLEYQKFSQERTKEAIVSIDIYDEKEHCWLMLRSNFSKNTFALNKDTGCITCKIENFPLTTGSYHFNIILSIENAEIYDFIQNVNYFDVVGGNFFGTGSSGNPVGCKILFKSNWQQL